MSKQIEATRSGLTAIKSLLSRDPCIHANTAIQMIDAMLAEQSGRQEPFAFTDSYGNLWTKSAAKQLIDKSILLPLYVGKPEH